MASSDQIRLFINEYLTEVPERSHGDEITVVCPQPSCGDSSGNRSVSLRTGLTNCWRCNVGGHISWWAKSLGFPVDFDDLEPGAIQIDELANLVDALDKVGDTVKPSGYVPSVALPSGFTRLADEPECAYSRLITRMARRKKLDFDDLANAGVGFTRDARRWEPYAIFPVFEWGRPVYYQGRTYVDKPGESTKLFPTKAECPLASRFWLYDIDEVSKNGGIVVFVEAILNVLSLKKELVKRGVSGYVPIAVFKHKLSAMQREKVMQAARRAKQLGNPVTEFVFMYDGRTRDEVENSKPGDAARSARVDAAALSGVKALGCSVSVVDLPDLVDPNDDAECAVDMLLRREPFLDLPCVLSL